jgi:hypothetical protein
VLFGLVLCGFYVRHAARAKDPILDLRLLGIETFRAGVVAGSLFRVGVGAVPFLLPLMFQLAYGMSAFQSGFPAMRASATAPLCVGSAFIARLLVCEGGEGGVMDIVKPVTPIPCSRIASDHLPAFGWPRRRCLAYSLQRPAQPLHLTLQRGDLCD